MFLGQHRDEILRKWESVVLAASEAGRQPGSLLRGQLPRFLDDLDVWLASPESSRSPGVFSGAGASEVSQLVKEISALRTAIFAVAASAAGIELGRVNEALDRAVAEAVERLGAEHANAERSCREAEARQLAVLEKIDVAFSIVTVLFDAEGRPVDYRFDAVNPAFKRQTGLVDAAGKRMRELAPDHEEQWFQIYGRVALTREPARFENEAKALDRWYDVQAVPVDDPARHRVAILFKDITARKKAEEALRDSEQRYRLLFDNMSMGFLYCRVIFDGKTPVDYVIEQVNPAFERQTTLRRSDVLGRRATEVMPDIDFGDWVDVLGRVALTGEPTHFDRHVRALDRWYEATAYCPKAGYFACIFNDVTQRRQVLEAIRLANERLRDADRRKDEFLGILSHELRNPLAPIRNSLYLLERTDPAGPQARRARAVVGRQVEHLTRLVDDLLEVTRISRGRIEISRTALDLRDLAWRTCDDHHSLFDRAGVVLDLSLPEEPVCVEADATRIAQVLGNLLQNAVKFTPKGQRVQVTVAAREREAELSVRDTGIGMEPDEVDQMFEPFVQVKQDLARTHGGLGLGLSLVKGLVELHGGTVDARSEGPGRGSEFIVRLPLAPARAVAAQEQRRRPRDNRSRKVLIIEDNLDAAETLAELLELDGHRVQLASDGKTGISLAQEVKPDVVLCDIGLPDLSGYEVARALRANDALRSTRLIAVTGYTQPEDKRLAKEAGFDAHLPKPPPLEMLNELLEDTAA
ncbi:MAG: ATP-binding protein [Myxococcales bacterium]